MAEQNVQVVRLRDDFYRDGFPKVMMALSIIVIAIGFLIAIFFYLFFLKPTYVQFSTGNEQRLIAPVPVTQPYLSTTHLLQWVSETLPTLFNYDFLNYKKQAQGSLPLFTEMGGEKFLEILDTYFSESTIEDSKLFVTATPAGAPVVLNEGLLEGRYAWWVQMPLLLNYVTADRNYTQNFQAQILIVRIPTTDSLEGVSIDNIILART